MGEADMYRSGLPAFIIRRYKEKEMLKSGGKMLDGAWHLYREWTHDISAWDSSDIT